MRRVERSRLFAVFLFMAALAPRVRAEETAEVAFHAGMMSLNTGKATEAGNQATSRGFAYGARWLHSATPYVAFGLDLDFLKPGDKTTDKLIANGRASTSIDSAALFGAARFGPTEGSLRPSFLLGLGIHYTSIRLAAAPNPGFGWADTGTTEKRTLIDSGGMGAAVKIQGGADYAFNDAFLAGVFLAWNYLGSVTYDTTAQAKALGLGPIRGSMSAITGGAGVTARF